MQFLLPQLILPFGVKVAPQTLILLAKVRILKGQQFKFKHMKEVNDTNFKDTLKTAQNLLVVDFWAEWCGPCRFLGPVLEELADEYASSVDFVKCNVDDSPETSQMFGIRNIPTVIFFKNGVQIDKMVGAGSKSSFDTKIKSLL